MEIDLGIQGFGILLISSLVFGGVAQLLFGRGATHWMWLIGAVAWFLGGLWMSEVMFSTATADDLQPIIDGLAFDEAMLGGLIVGVAAVLVTWLVTRVRTHHVPTS